MKNWLPTRYERTRAICGGMSLVWAVVVFITPLPGHPFAQSVVLILSNIWMAAYLISGLLKPLHDDTEGKGA